METAAELPSAPPLAHQGQPGPETGASVWKLPHGLWPERYELIDAWRGLAALAVCVHHVAGVFIGGPAVMLFFVISGYCIAASADSVKRKGLGFGQFMMRRVRRIYPPYLLSIAFWAATRYIKLKQTGVNDFARHSWVDWVQNLTLTQWVTLVFHPLSYAAKNPTPFVAAYWSLGYEEQFYLIVGLMLLVAVPLGVSILQMTVGLMVLGLVVNVIYPEIAYGIFLEYWALFGIGVLVFYRLCRIKSAGWRRAVDASLFGILAGSIYMRWFSGAAWATDQPGLPLMERVEIRVVYQELMIASAFGLVLIKMRPLSSAITRQLWFKPLAGLGVITFSLYLIHQFNLTLMSKVGAKLLETVHISPLTSTRTEIHPDGTPTWYYLTLQIMLHLALATVFWFFCERPFLNKTLLPAARNPPTTPAAKIAQTGPV